MKQTRNVNYNGQQYSITFVFEKGQIRLYVGETEYREYARINACYCFDIVLQDRNMQVVVYKEKEIFLVDNGKVVGTDEQIKLEPLTLKQRMFRRFVPLLLIVACYLESIIYYISHLNDSINPFSLCIVLLCAWFIATQVMFFDKIEYFSYHPAISNKEKYKRIYIHTAIYVLIYVAICVLRAFNL